jgi:hypothetical protein
MTPGSNDIGERRGQCDLPRRDVFIWAASILFLNHVYGALTATPSASIGQRLVDLGSVGVFQYLAWYAVFRLLGTSGRAEIAEARDVIVTAALCLLALSPSSRMIWIAAGGAAVYLTFCNAGDAKLRAAGIVLGALSVQQFWGFIFFNFVAFPLLGAETAVVGTVLAAVRAGTVWHDNVVTGPNGYGIIIYGACSSFHNVSAAVLCWVALTKLRRPRWRAGDFAVGGIACSTMILLNLVRLCLMSWDVDLFRFLHDGAGADLFAAGGSAAVLLISLYGAGPAKRAI